MSLRREKVLVVSTDPAHNLSDAFSQKFGRDPILVNGFDNLFCMEIDANADVDKIQAQMQAETAGEEGASVLGNIMADLTSSIPGIDEAMSFAELMKQVQTMDYDVIIFDTAPTGHTLRLLSFPTIMEKALSKVVELKNKFGGMISQMSSMFGGGGRGPNGESIEDSILGKLEETRAIINKVNKMFQDPDTTTFVCVCIPEFLSIYETERLVQELSKFGIDTHNVVINQVLFPEKDAEELNEWYEKEKPKLSKEAAEICGKMMARKKMQDKYIGQCFDLYGDDFHIILQPLLDHEVRGVERLREFSETLVNPVDVAAVD